MSYEFPYRDEVRAELARVIESCSQRRLSRQRLAVPAIGLTVALAVLFTILVVDHGDKDPRQVSLPTTIQPGPLPTFNEAPQGRGSFLSLAITPETFEQVSLADANDRATFDVLFPNVPEANLSNLLGVQDGDRLQMPQKPRVLELDPPAGPGRPIGTVMMEFPPPTPTSDEVRVPFIWLWQEPARGKTELNIEHEVERGRRVAEACDVNGAVALCQDARSPKDEFSANAAYLEFIRDDVRVTVSGGDKLEVLIRLAESLKPLSG
jgi:hypothetical protein